MGLIGAEKRLRWFVLEPPQFFAAVRRRKGDAVGVHQPAGPSGQWAERTVTFAAKIPERFSGNKRKDCDK